MQRSEMRFYNAKLCARLQKMFCSTDGSQECSELHNCQMEEVRHKQDPCENYSAAQTEQLTQTSFSENADQEPDDHSEIQRCCVERGTRTHCDYSPPAVLQTRKKLL